MTMTEVEISMILMISWPGIMMLKTWRYLERSWKAASLAGLPDTYIIKSK